MTISGAINDLNNLLNADDVPVYYKPSIKKVIETIEQEQQHQWTLCSERLPEEHEWVGTKKFGTTISDEVHVTFEALDGNRFCEHCRFQNGKISPSMQISIDAISKGAKPVAWREMPEPYNRGKG